jgi:hypothetical protein
MADHDVLLGAAVIGGAAAIIAVRVAVIGPATVISDARDLAG